MSFISRPTDRFLKLHTRTQNRPAVQASHLLYRVSCAGCVELCTPRPSPTPRYLSWWGTTRTRRGCTAWWSWGFPGLGVSSARVFLSSSGRAPACPPRSTLRGRRNLQPSWKSSDRRLFPPRPRCSGGPAGETRKRAEPSRRIPRPERRCRLRDRRAPPDTCTWFWSGALILSIKKWKKVRRSVFEGWAGWINEHRGSSFFLLNSIMTAWRLFVSFFFKAAGAPGSPPQAGRALTEHTVNTARLLWVRFCNSWLSGK